MPKRSRTDADPNVTAFNIVRQVVGDTPATGPEAFTAMVREIAGALADGESPEALAERFWPRIQEIARASGAAELGRMGGKKGGRARAQNLSAEERSAIARRAALARWHNEADDGEAG